MLALCSIAVIAPSPPARRKLPASPPRPAAQLERIRFWTAPDHTRLVLDFSGPAPQPSFRLAGPSTFEVFVPRARKSAAVSAEFVGDSLVADLFPAESESGLAVRIGLKKAVTPLGFVLPPTEGMPNRIVVDVPAPPDLEADRQLEQRVSEIKKARRLIVAIDAGHGGDDSGALGYRRLQEADITLAIAKKLRAELDQVPGVSAFMTRTGDYFVPLRRRIDIARKVQADLFVSIHCNASRNRDANGTEVYFLSLTGASDEASRALAEAENAADLIGGVPAQAGDDLTSILFDLRQTDTLRRSSDLAEILVDALRAEDRLSTRGVKQAGFVVLKAPEIPSVLVEVAFITNPREAAMLKDGHFQAKFAERLAEGIHGYASQWARASSN